MAAPAWPFNDTKQQLAKELAPVLAISLGVFRIVVLIVLTLAPIAAIAQSAFQGFTLAPPCQGPPLPAAAPPGGSPAIAVWTESTANRVAWQASPCLQWASGHTRLVTALAASLHGGSLDDLLGRFGALSHYNSIRFWSVLNQTWETLVTSAGFVDGPQATYSQRDLTSADFVAGRVFYYYEINNAGRVLHRLTVRRRTGNEVEIGTENITPVRYSLLTVFQPTALQTATLMQRQGPNAWDYYQAIRVGDGADWIALRSPSPYINRLTGFYRYMAGIATDSQPPAAPR